jgi:hypothetical protein
MPLAPACAALALVVVLAGCGRTFRSCAAYMMIIGPTALSITCPPPGFKGTETTPIGDSVTVQDNLGVAAPTRRSLPQGNR